MTNKISSGENKPTIARRDDIILPRKLVVDMYNNVYFGASYACYVALVLVMGKIMRIINYSLNNNIISFNQLKKEWEAYGFNTDILVSLLHNINRSSLRDYITIISDSTITVTSKWVSAVRCRGADANATDTVRIPAAIIPYLLTHAPAVVAIFYGLLTQNARPDMMLLVKINDGVPFDELQAMIDEVLQGLDTQKDDIPSVQTQAKNEC